jgi:predicted GTPase
MGKRIVVVRHPMPYGDLTKQVVQRFACYQDFDKHQCTIEEREEYEPLVDQEIVVYAGIDYGQILKAAEKEADIIVWDGGNNDTPFYYPAVHIVVFDPHRAGHEKLYYPGETNMIMADIAIINKVNGADSDKVQTVRRNIEKHAPKAEILLAESAVLVDDPNLIRGKRVLVVEDGPTLTHGEMSFGAGTIAAQMHGADRIVDPRPYITGAIKETFEAYPHIGNVLPATGYSQDQIHDLELTINKVDCELVLFATPIDLPKIVSINKPFLKVYYEYQDHNRPFLKETLLKHMQNLKI